MSILVIDPRPIHRRTMSHILADLGYEPPRGCGSLREAERLLEYMAARSKPEKVDLIFVGWELPTDQIRMLVEYARTSPIAQAAPVVGVSDQAFASDIIAALALGIDAFMIRPLIPVIVSKKLETLLGVRNTEPASVFDAYRKNFDLGTVV